MKKATTAEDFRRWAKQDLMIAIVGLAGIGTMAIAGFVMTIIGMI